MNKEIRREIIGGERSAEAQRLQKELCPKILEILKDVKPDEGLTSEEIAIRLGIDPKKEGSRYWTVMGALDVLSGNATFQPLYTYWHKIGRFSDTKKEVFVYFDPKLSHNI